MQAEDSVHVLHDAVLYQVESATRHDFLCLLEQKTDAAMLN